MLTSKNSKPKRVFCFNGVIWERIAKTKYVSFEQLKFGVYDSVANFNIGRKSSILTYEKLDMIPEDIH